MKPMEFPESNTVWAKDQPEYRALPAYTNERETISLWRLTWRERFACLLIGKLWLRQCNFGAALQPQLPTVDSPFVPAGEPSPAKEER